MNKELIKKLLWVLLFAAGLFLIGEAKAHEYGHAETIKHLTGFHTPGVDADQACPGQNKVLLYHDIDDNGVMDGCSTIWVEHTEVHIILSYPDNNGRCECEGYIWFDGDSQ